MNSHIHHFLELHQRIPRNLCLLSLGLLLAPQCGFQQISLWPYARGRLTRAEKACTYTSTEEWSDAIYFRETMKLSKEALFTVRKEGGNRVVYATEEAGKMAKKKCYYPGVDNHPLIDRGSVAFNKDSSEDFLVLVQDKVNDDIPTTVKNLNEAADLLQKQFPKVLLIVNVIGASGLARKRKELQFPYVLARRKEEELVNFYSASFTPIADFVRRRSSFVIFGLAPSSLLFPFCNLHVTSRAME